MECTRKCRCDNTLSFRISSYLGKPFVLHFVSTAYFWSLLFLHMSIKHHGRQKKVSSCHIIIVSVLCERSKRMGLGKDAIFYSCSISSHS
jgi:hypothetical protein